MMLLQREFRQYLKATVLSSCVIIAIAQATVSWGATTLRMAWPTADSKVDPYAIVAHGFAQELELLAPGQFKVAFFPNHQLGDETDALQGMGLGTIDIGIFTNNQVANLVPGFQIYDLPFMFASYGQVYRVMDGEIGKGLMKQLSAHGITGLGSPVAGFRNVINNVRPVRTPDDLRGMKLRMPPVAIFLDSFRALGANPVPMEWSQCFTAVQQGTIDGLEIPLSVIEANKYAEVTKYLSLTRHTFNALSLLMSTKTLNRLDAKQQAAVREAAARSVSSQRKVVEAGDSQVLKNLEAQGMKVNEIADVKAFRTAVKPVYDTYRHKLGAALVDKAIAEVSK
jgi:tripartite ATP-independent transporter DctP family solute receptor